MPGYHDPIQHNRRLSSFSLDAIEEYFAQLNPIAKRIAYDINDTKANYGQLWETLDYHEQNDIINDTLIKPEISLRYFDNFLTPTPTNSSGNSYQSSTDSLTAIVLKDVGAARDSMGNREEEGDKKKLSTLKAYGGKFSPHGVKNFYSYDGRNLYTFGMQKVALKVIQDDALGCFRDEHSRPFCYRTKSQINLFVLQPSAETMAARKAIALPSKILTPPIKSTALKSRDESSPQDEESKKALDNYHRLQHQLKMNLNEKKSQDLQKSSSSTYISIKPSSITANRKIIKSPDTSYKLESKENTNSKNAKSSLLQNYLNSTQINATPKIGVNYAVFSDAYNTAEESSNLLQHCGQSDLATASCSSAATSDDDEKTLEAEDVHLLDNDSNIRKGFDFLNNW
ncbi:hypothetical protein FF38_05379 [Lucilia cuprina]|uniref:DUF4706 domain-containing protein n=1 Tax=Lucilia cuprina TaxID=7375 RepID=A0A0L0C406_LUCCU|nr:hypothetical protein FF38_05379 [Lucilia cuprina]